MMNDAKEDPCIHGLTPECFRSRPLYARRQFATRLLYMMLPEELTKKLQWMPPRPPGPEIYIPGDITPPIYIAPAEPGPPVTPGTGESPPALHFPSGDITLAYEPTAIEWLTPNFYTGRLISFIWRIQQSDSMFTPTQAFSATVTQHDICTDGTSFFRPDGTDTLYKYDLSWNLLDSTTIPGAHFPVAITFDGTYIHVLSGTQLEDYRFTPDLTYIDTLTSPATTWGATFYNDYIYTANVDTNKITRFHPDITGVQTGPVLSYSPRGLVFAGPAFWVLETYTHNIHRATLADLGF